MFHVFNSIITCFAIVSYIFLYFSYDLFCVCSLILCFFFVLILYCYFCFFFSSRRRHTSCALVTGVQTCALPIWFPDPSHFARVYRYRPRQPSRSSPDGWREVSLPGYPLLLYQWVFAERVEPFLRLLEAMLPGKFPGSLALVRICAPRVSCRGDATMCIPVRSRGRLRLFPFRSE